MGRSINPPPGTIKGIQRGTTTAGNTVTISAVDPARTELRLLGSSLANASTDARDYAHITLSSSTTISTARANVGVGVTTLSWELTEFF